MDDKQKMKKYTDAYTNLMDEYIISLHDLQKEYQEKLKKLGEDYTNGRH